MPSSSKQTWHLPLKSSGHSGARQRLLSARNTSLKELTYFRRCHWQHDFHDFQTVRNSPICSANFFWHSPQTQLLFSQSNHASFNQLCTFWIDVLSFGLSSGLPVSSKKGPSCLESTVPIVTDSCGVYGTFYVDLMGSGLKTFNSPGRCPKMPHGVPHQQGAETIQIFSQPMAKTAAFGSLEALPWKQAIRPQPRMGVLRESWEKSHSKQGTDNEMFMLLSLSALRFKAHHLPPSNVMPCNIFYNTN